MEKLRIMSVFGTRPEAIKMAPLVKELASRDEIESLCCVTAQHREMLDSVMQVFGLKADADLDIMTPRQTLSTITCKCLTGMDEVIDRFGDPPPSVYTLVQVALLRADAGKVGVTDISQKNGCLKFLLAQFDMQKVSALYARPEFKGRLKVDAGAKPGIILRLKTRTHVIEQARAFVSAWADAQGDRA